MLSLERVCEKRNPAGASRTLLGFVARCGSAVAELGTSRRRGRKPTARHGYLCPAPMNEVASRRPRSLQSIRACHFLASRPPLPPYPEAAGVAIKDHKIARVGPASPAPSSTRLPPVRANHADIAESVDLTTAWLCRARHDGRTGCEHLSPSHALMVWFAVHRRGPRGGRHRQGRQQSNCSHRLLPAGETLALVTEAGGVPSFEVFRREIASSARRLACLSILRVASRRPARCEEAPAFVRYALSAADGATPDRSPRVHA
jgi:hypothetical protein